MQSDIIAKQLKKAEVCTSLGISPRTLEKLVTARHLPPGVRVGRWSFWSTKVVDDWRRRQFAVQEAWRPS